MYLRISINFLARLLRVCTPSLTGFSVLTPLENFTRKNIYPGVGYQIDGLWDSIFPLCTPRSSNCIQSLQKEKSVHSWIDLLIITYTALGESPRTPLTPWSTEHAETHPHKSKFRGYLLPTSSTLAAPFLTVDTLLTFFSVPGVQSERSHG